MLHHQDTIYHTVKPAEKSANVCDKYTQGYKCSTLMEAICSSETLVHTRAKWHHIPEDDTLHSAAVHRDIT
jgi:hypothetical protein